MPGTARILSIDGGGIRGIIPAAVLARIESEVGRPISELFHLVAGTSTGGILAVGLAKPSGYGKSPHSGMLGAKDLGELYVERGGEIFEPSLCKWITSIGGLADEQYSAEGLERVLDDYLGDAPLSAASTDVLITGYNIEARKPTFFKSWRIKDEPERDFLMRDIARATSAAPTYFEPAFISGLNTEEKVALIDGGVFANNPAMCAYSEARLIYPGASDYLVVSLGTGEFTRPIPYNDAKNWGLIQWMRPSLDVIFDGVSDTVDYQLRHVVPPVDGRQRYFRFQTALGEDEDEMDNVKRANIRALQRRAEEILERQKDEIAKVVEELRQPRESIET